MKSLSNYQRQTLLWAQMTCEKQLEGVHEALACAVDALRGTTETSRDLERANELEDIQAKLWMIRNSLNCLLSAPEVHRPSFSQLAVRGQG